MEEKITIQEAREIAERLEKSNNELKELLDRKEKIAAEEILSGKSSAGQIEKIDPEKVKIDRVNALLKPTGLHI